MAFKRLELRFVKSIASSIWFINSILKILKKNLFKFLRVRKKLLSLSSADNFLSFGISKLKSISFGSSGSPKILFSIKKI
jgi:hypothetical protein